MVQDSQNIQALLDAMAKAWDMHDAKAFLWGAVADTDHAQYESYG
jgi:hypothetical protein